MHAGSCENTYKKTRKSWSSGGSSWNFVTSERGSRESEEGRGGGKEGEMLLSVYCRVLLPPFVTRIPTSFLLSYEDPRGAGGPSFVGKAPGGGGGTSKPLRRRESLKGKIVVG